MTRDEILYAAQNHWLYDLANPKEELAGWLVEFARVIAAAEREACIALIEEQCRAIDWIPLTAAIRARGQG